MKARNLVSILSRIALLSAAVGAFAQPPDSLWSRTYGGNGWDECYSAQQTSDGGFMFAGSSSSFSNGGTDFWLVKTDANGDSLWSRTFASSGNLSVDVCRSAQQTSDGGYIMAGKTRHVTQPCFDYWLVKADTNGDSVWSRSFGSYSEDWGQCVQQLPDGGYILAGFGSSMSENGFDFWLIRTDENGDSLWSRMYGGTAADYCYSAQLTTDGGYIMAGYTDSSGLGWADFLLVKANANGDHLWSRTYGGRYGERCYCVRQTSDGGYVLVGCTDSFGGGDADVWLVKTDGNGDSLWSRTFGGYREDMGRAVQQTTDGGYIVAGTTESFGAGWYDAWAVRTDANGDSLWSCAFGGILFDEFHTVQQSSDSGYIFAGKTGSFGDGDYDFWLVKTGPELAAEGFEVSLPEQYTLHSNWPNPFNPTTQIAYDLPRSGHVTLTVYDLLGREVMTLVDGVQTAGSHYSIFDGSGLASGIYLCRLQAGDFVEARKMVLLK